MNQDNQTSQQHQQLQSSFSVNEVQYPCAIIQNSQQNQVQSLGVNDVQYPCANIQNHQQHQVQSLGVKDVENPNADVEKMMCRGFIRKVYGIISFQLIITVSICGLTFFDDVKTFFVNYKAIFWVCLALNIAIIIPLVCFKSIARKVPVNYILLTLWTICESYMIAFVCTKYDPSVVLTAAAWTCAVTIAVSIYACTTKVDFTFLGAFLFASICLMLCFAIVLIFVNIRALHVIYCVLGVLVYSIYLIYDTQLVMGKFGIEYVMEDYIIAALMIYIDIIQIFLYILQMFGKK